MASFAPCVGGVGAVAHTGFAHPSTGCERAACATAQIDAALDGIVHGRRFVEALLACRATIDPMELTDYRLLVESAYGRWKRCHATYLDIACRIACGAEVPKSTVAVVLAELEESLADVVSISRQTAAPEQTILGAAAARPSPT